MSDDFSSQDRTDPSPLSFLGAGPVTAAILGGGFLLGILAGGFFLLGGSNGPAERSSRPAVAARQAVRSSETKPLAPKTDADSDSVSGNLAAERDRLRQELEAAKLRREVEALRNELVNLKSSPVSTESASEFPARRRNSGSPVATSRTAPRLPTSRPSTTRRPSTSQAASQPQGAATLAYWNQLNAIILQEAALRAAPAGGVTATNAAGFLDARIQAGQFAVDSIRQLDTTGVDSRVVKLGEQLADWYDEGRRVAQSGKQLLTTASVQDRQGSAGKGYQAAERNHSQSVNKINAEGEQTRQAMSRKYRLNFPPLN